MQIREVVEADAADCRFTARASLKEAYQDEVSFEAIDTAVEKWYADETFAEKLTDPTHHLLAAIDDTLVGFIEFTVSDAAEEGTIQWVHVDPGRWGEGIGESLLEAAEAELFDVGVSRVEATALAKNEDVIEMYEANEYIEGTGRETSIWDETFVERSYLKFAPGEEPRLIEARETDLGTFYVALDEHKVGSKGDIYVAYRDEDRNVRYGFFCDNCRSVNASMDSMGRVQCNDCGNTAKPTRWDAAYL